MKSNRASVGRRGWSAALASALLLTAAATGPAQAQIGPNDPLTKQNKKMGGPMPAEQMALSFEHLDLAMRIDPAAQQIAGDATLSFRTKAPVRTLYIDLYTGFQISAIYLDGRLISPRTYENPEGQLRIRLPRALPAGGRVKARIVYAGAPHIAKRPPWDGGVIWSKTPDGQPWVDSSLWGVGCDILFPCIDHPLGKPQMADLHYTVPAPLVAPGNGTFISMTEKDGWRTYNWRARSPQNYGIVINVAPFKLLEGDYKSRFGNTIPMRFWYLPGNEKKAAELFKEFPVALDFFESQLGPYGWGDQKMGVVQSTHRGMEHQTINSYGANFEKTRYGFDGLMHHEFSHEFFANQLSAANYDDLWLHEGTGSYMQPLLGKYLNGDIDYFAQLKQTRSGIRNERPVVSGREMTNDEVYADKDGPRGDIYSKGSLILHTMRNLIGDKAFYESLRRLVYGRPDPRPGNFQPMFGSTKGFLAIVNQVTGQDLKWFFDVYLYRAALPEVVSERRGDRLRLSWKTPDNLPFPMPIDVQVDDRVVTLPMANGRGELTVPEMATVTIDPHSKLLRQSDAIDAFQKWQAEQPERRP